MSWFKQSQHHCALPIPEHSNFRMQFRTQFIHKDLEVVERRKMAARFSAGVEVSGSADGRALVYRHSSSE
jgi:hypothetical protein